MGCGFTGLLAGPLEVPAALQLAAGGSLVKQDTYMSLPHNLMQNNQGTSTEGTIIETDNRDRKISSQETGLNTYTLGVDQGEVIHICLHRGNRWRDRVHAP